MYYNINNKRKETGRKNEMKELLNNEAALTIIKIAARGREHNVIKVSQASEEELMLERAEPSDTEYTARNTVKNTYIISAGLYVEKGKVQSHNINWDNVKQVSGATFDFRDFLKSKGFKWQPDYKKWVRD